MAEAIDPEKLHAVDLETLVGVRTHAPANQARPATKTKPSVMARLFRSRRRKV
jgi:hypothetical protein